MTEKMTEKERLIHLLLTADGRKHKNVNFMRGDSPDVTEQAFCRELNHALVAKRAGVLKPLGSLPEYEQVDVETLVRSL
jgi:hypothetical protein